MPVVIVAPCLIGVFGGAVAGSPEPGWTMLTSPWAKLTRTMRTWDGATEAISAMGMSAIESAMTAKQV